MKFVFSILFSVFPIVILAQNDSIWMKNDDVLVGELKSLSKSVITFKTSYSDKDFKIDFNEVTRISTQNIFVVHFTDGSRFTGKINSTNNKKLEIINHYGQTKETELANIILLSEIDIKFWNRFTGTLDIGFNLAKTNNNKQLTFAGNLKYNSDKWNSKLAYNVLYSDQDNVDKIERKELSLNAQRFLQKWFLSLDVSYLLSTELGIKNRINPGFGVGRNLFVTNKLYWLAGVGLNYNIEEYFDSQLNKESTELKILTQFEMFNFEDLSIFTKATGYPSLSEKGRFRLDYNFVFKYDLPFDFYIKAEFTLNYDNQPAISGSYSDYIFSSGFGWELK